MIIKKNPIIRKEEIRAFKKMSVESKMKAKEIIDKVQTYKKLNDDLEKLITYYETHPGDLTRVKTAFDNDEKDFIASLKKGKEEVEELAEKLWNFVINSEIEIQKE